jgi:hypothetical protein
MWDYASMKAALTEVGFADIRRAKFNDSVDDMFELVEDRERFYWSTEQGAEFDECAVEARKAGE